jgi:AcrR family transcriptional regulator
VTIPSHATTVLAHSPDDQRDGRRRRGMQNRAAVLERALQLASIYGLEGLSIGRLTADLGVHKSTVNSLFGSKEALQLETVAAARRVLIDQVVVPALGSEPGLRRLSVLGDAWCDYVGADVYPGGCLLCAASAEMDGRPGPVRHAVQAVMREWIDILVATTQEAVGRHELREDVEPVVMAFGLNALGMAANWQRQLFDDDDGVAYARSAWHAELQRCSAPTGPRGWEQPGAP